MNIIFRPKVFFISVLVLFLYTIFSLTTVHASSVQYLAYIRTDTTLDPSITYVMDGPVTVFAGATLTIPAGTQIHLTPGATLSVFGALVVNGTASSHVSMTGGVFSAVVPTVQSPVVQSPEVTPPTVTQTPTVSAIANISTGTTFAAILFKAHSTETLKYVDIDNGATAIQIEDSAHAQLDHVVISDCDKGIIAVSGANLSLTNTTFSNVATPAQINFQGTFTHTNTTFINTGIKGWEIGASMTAGDVMKFDSTDGEYAFPYGVVAKNSSLIISPGVTVVTRDGQGMEIDGTLIANGTSDAPITVHGAGVCTTHTPVMTFSSSQSVSVQHVNFRDLCAGISATTTALNMSTVSFNTIAGTALQSTGYAYSTIDHIAIHNVYQAISLSNQNKLTVNIGDISQVNGSGPAIASDDHAQLVASNLSIDTAMTCISATNGTSFTGTALSLSHCSKFGIDSENQPHHEANIKLSNSEISHSGTALMLTSVLVPLSTHNKFHDNMAGVVANTIGKLDVSNNWWGSNNGPRIDSNPTGDGDTLVATNVTELIYRPWTGMADAPQHNPIIIVPGITGSVLTKNYDDKSELWPNINKLALNIKDSFLNDLELLQGGTPSTVRPVVVGDVIRSIDSTDIFATMITSLKQQGYIEGTNLFVLPYDWRLSNTTNQALLGDAITNALAKSGKTKVNIIAHSMGGLLVEDYMSQNPSAPIEHVFNIGVPHTGAPKAFQTLMYGDDMGFSFTVAGLIKVPLLNADRVKTISQNMPAVYELLPSQKYIDTVGSYLTDLTQNPSSLTLDGIQKLMVADGRNSKMFPFAQALHGATDTLNASNVATYNFVGCAATKTIGSYLLTKKQELTLTGLQLVPEHRLRYTAGDGVVPITSANIGNGALNYYVSAGSHGTLPSLPQIQQTILDILNGKSVVIGTGISDNTTSCALAGDTVEVHSPVTLDIYDDQGRHNGPTTDGQIEMGIPNVQYNVIGDEKFVFLPSGPTYKIVTHAQAVGTYDMYISHSANDDTITSQTYFSAVPITATTSSTTTISPTSTNYSLAVDNDGDGVVDNTVVPSSILNAVQLQDTVAPITTATLKDGVVTLSASDDNSGVLNTKYSTDTINWQTYNTPFKVSAGITVYFLSIDKAGNTEAIQQLSVPDSTTLVTTPSITPDTTTITSPTTTTDTSTHTTSSSDTTTSDTMSTVSTQTPNVESPQVTSAVTNNTTNNTTVFAAPIPDPISVASAIQTTTTTLIPDDVPDTDQQADVIDSDNTIVEEPKKILVSNDKSSEVSGEDGINAPSTTPIQESTLLANTAPVGHFRIFTTLLIMVLFVILLIAKRYFKEK